jgi:hypothetical protein
MVGDLQAWLWNRNSAVGRPARPRGRDPSVCSSTPRRSSTRFRLVADTLCPSTARYAMAGPYFFGYLLDVTGATVWSLTFVAAVMAADAP